MVKANHYIIEAAHFYAAQHHEFETITTELDYSISLAEKIVKILVKLGNTVERSILVDETAISTHWSGVKSRILFESKSIGSFSNYIMNAGYFPSFYFQESQFEKEAKRVVEDILSIVTKNKEYQLSDDGKKIIKRDTGERVKLLGKNNNLDYPSCEVLDLCLYREKLLLADVSITILPDSYQSQQERVKSLFLLFKEKPAVIVVYFSPEGMVSKIDSWSNKVNIIKELLHQALIIDTTDKL